jgi:hypothetical protein
MNRHITIVGAGQAGLQLGIGLLKNGYSVSLFSEKSAEEIQKGRITSSQGIFDTALNCERELAISYWENIYPKNTTVSLSIAQQNQNNPEIFWKGRTKPYQSIDQRMKFPIWINTFKELGGEFIIEKIDFSTLDKISKQTDLVIVATGKGDIGQHFQTDCEKSTFFKPMRQLALCYANNTTGSTGVRANIIPGVGEFFTMPGITFSGACEMMLFEGLFGGPFDCWQHIQDPQEQLEKSIELLKKYVPWEAIRFKNAKLTDTKATLTGSYTPVVKHPILKLPSGRFALGMGDAIVLNDPIAGQGANNAAKCAHTYLHQIIKRENRSFDQAWMQKTFNEFWRDAYWSTTWSNMLLSPPPPHILTLFKAARDNQAIADCLANIFDAPKKAFPWILNPEDTMKFIAYRKETPALAA